MSTQELVGELDRAEVQYELVWHRKTSTAAEEAAALFVPREQVAKTLVLATRAGYVRAVVPASARIDLSKAGKVLGGDETTRLATEQELAEAFPMFELGAVPPFGGGPGDRTIVDVHLTGQDSVLVEAGSHSASLKIGTKDLLSLADAELADLCEE